MVNVELPGLARGGDFEVFGTLNSELRTQNSELRVAPVVHILHVPLTIHERQGPDELSSWWRQTTRSLRGAAPRDCYERDVTDLADQSRWTPRSTTNAAQDGSQIHIASLARIRTPCELKNSLTPIGDTRTGRTGKKYLVVSNGEKNATPNPPFVIASSTPCETVQREK
jgi:hypothetical protein